MTFREAALSGRRFRQEGDRTWLRIDDDLLRVEAGFCTGLSLKQAMADNWEIEEPIIKLGRQAFYDAVTAELEGWMPYPDRSFDRLFPEGLAKRLGLEE